MEATCSNAVGTGDDEQSSERSCSLSEFSTLGAHLLEILQSHLTSQPDVTREPSTNERLLISLRATRSQLARASRSLREQLASNASLHEELQAERTARLSAENTLANTTMEKALLVERINSLSEQTLDLRDETLGHMQTYSPGTEMDLTKALQPYSTSLASSSPTSDGTMCYLSGSSQSHDQHYATLALEDLDQPERSTLKHSLLKQRCETLSAKVSSLQANMTTCLDECAAALELERHLRYEVEGRLHAVFCEMQSLKCDMQPRQKTLAPPEPSDDSSTGSSDDVHRMNAIAIASFERCDALERENLEQRDIIRELSQRLAEYTERVQMLTSEVTRYENEVAPHKKTKIDQIFDKSSRIVMAMVCNLFIHRDCH